MFVGCRRAFPFHVFVVSVVVVLAGVAPLEEAVVEVLVVLVVLVDGVVGWSVVVACPANVGQPIGESS